MLAQNALLRQRSLGLFADLLLGVTVDGAMLLWLDGGDSRKEKPNENVARTFLELFSLGVDNHSTKDLRQAAHGSAALMFLLGSAIKAGVHGSDPNLEDLEDGDPKLAIAFRHVDATVSTSGCTARQKRDSAKRSSDCRCDHDCVHRLLFLAETIPEGDSGKCIRRP